MAARMFHVVNYTHINPSSIFKPQFLPHFLPVHRRDNSSESSHIAIQLKFHYSHTWCHCIVSTISSLLAHFSSELFSLKLVAGFYWLCFHTFCRHHIFQTYPDISLFCSPQYWEILLRLLQVRPHTCYLPKKKQKQKKSGQTETVKDRNQNDVGSCI